jgi:hypothetical protein
MVEKEIRMVPVGIWVVLVEALRDIRVTEELEHITLIVVFPEAAAAAAEVVVEIACLAVEEE